MTQEKKFFVPELRTYNNNLTKRWRIEWYIPSPANGKPKRCSKPVYGNINTGCTVEERIKLAEIIIRDLKPGLPKPKRKTVFDKVFSIKKIDWSDKTISSYTTVVENYLEWLKSKKVEKVTDTQFYGYLQHLHESGHSRNNIAKYRDTIYTFYSYAIKFKLLTYNPVQKESRIKKKPRSKMFFTDKQIALFKNYDVDKQLWLAIQFLFYCFIRPGEQRHMKIEWINFENRFIEVPAEWSKNGKTQKVAIPDCFFDAIKHLENYPNHYYVLSKSGTPGVEQISTKWLNSQHRKVLDTLKIRGNYSFYSWKHTGAVKAVKAGINLKDLQMQLRHHSLDMVNEYLKNLGIMDSEDLRYKFPSIIEDDNLLKNTTIQVDSALLLLVIKKHGSLENALNFATNGEGNYNHSHAV